MSGEAPWSAAHTRSDTATGSYVSTDEVVEREARLLLRRSVLSRDAWRRFAVPRLVVAGIIAGMGAALLAVDSLDAGQVVSAISVFLGVFTLLSVLELWALRGRRLRMLRAAGLAATPPGSRVDALFTPTSMLFRLPSHAVTLDLASVRRAWFEDGFLVMMDDDSEALWLVPDELLGQHGPAVVRAALGTRLREPL